MVTDYVAPEFDLGGFNCPWCGAYARQVWYHGLATHDERKQESKFKGWLHGFGAARCDKCENYSLWRKGSLIYPLTSVAPLPSMDMPDNVKHDYEEARAIFSQSPRGAAALLRLAIQELMPAVGESGKDLDTDIGNLVKKGLPELIQKALDGVRVIGNNAVHPGQIDVDDNPDIALSLFTLVNLIVENVITRMKKVDELYELLPETAKEHIEKRDKGAP